MNKDDVLRWIRQWLRWGGGGGGGGVNDVRGRLWNKDDVLRWITQWLRWGGWGGVGGVNDVRGRLSTKMMFFGGSGNGWDGGGGGGLLMTCVVDCQQRWCSSVDQAMVEMGGMFLQWHPSSRPCPRQTTCSPSSRSKAFGKAWIVDSSKSLVVLSAKAVESDRLAP